ncbi:tautomerase family protein [uncultured Pseudoramibacter sp.]|uniref:tautomerase family protein n=1 Tax=uncultured Pseudoramibacter sp. TaxID=1623493 RepID=UPI0025CE9DAC|nr:tautomerase family protein [uncultured Pseudoramibacter sp.]
MPIIKIDWTVEKTPSEKRSFIDKVTDIVSGAIHAPKDVVNVLIRDLPKENVREDAAVFTITWSKTSERNQSAKHTITSEITNLLINTTDLNPGRIVFFFHDLDGENVGVAGKMRE